MSLRDLLPEGTYAALMRRSGRAEPPAPPQDSGPAAEAAAEAAAAEDGVLMVPCPTCGRRVAYTADNPCRPFCSLRCKYLDLGAWADGRRVLPGDPQGGEEAPPPPVHRP